MNIQNQKHAEAMAQELKLKFPDIMITGVVPSATDPNDAWIRVVYPENEEREMQIRFYAAKLSGDYLDKYGTHIVPLSGHAPTAPVNT